MSVLVWVGGEEGKVSALVLAFASGMEWDGILYWIVLYRKGRDPVYSKIE